MGTKREQKEKRWTRNAQRRHRENYLAIVSDPRRLERLLRDPLRLGSYAALPGPPVIGLSLNARELAVRSAWPDIILHREVQYVPYRWWWGEPADESDDPDWKTFDMNAVLDKIKAPLAWKTTRGQGATIAIVDSGVHGDLPEFKGKPRISLTNTVNHWTDSTGHGTMCAAIACGTSEHGAEFNGVAPDATLLPIKLRGYGEVELHEVWSELLRQYKAGRFPRGLVVSNSFGPQIAFGPERRAKHALALLVQACIEAGIVFIFAAGNDHVRSGYAPTADAPTSIWGVNGMDGVICVSAVDWEGSNQTPRRRHVGASRGKGEWSSTTVKPDVVAPAYGRVRWNRQYTSYPWWGTSGAAPQVAGLAALILSKNYKLKPAHIQNIITSSTTPLKGPATCVGNGMINCDTAIAQTPP